MSFGLINSPNPAYEFDAWIAEARMGSGESLGKLLAVCRDYLLLLAEKELPTDLRAKVGASDVVQESLLEAKRNFARFDGTSKAQMMVWLRAIMQTQTARLNRHYRNTLKRDLARETGAFPQGELRASAESPSAVLMRAQGQTDLQRAFAILPGHYQRVIVLKNFESRSFVDIGQEMGRSPDAIRKLWFRAISSLQQLLGDSSGDG